MRLHLHAVKTAVFFFKSDSSEVSLLNETDRDLSLDRHPKLLLPLLPLQPDFMCELFQDSEAESLLSLTMIHIIPSTPRLWAVKDAHLPLNPFPLIPTEIQLGIVQLCPCNSLRNPTAHCQMLSDMAWVFREMLKPNQSWVSSTYQVSLDTWNLGPVPHSANGKNIEGHIHCHKS